MTEVLKRHNYDDFCVGEKKVSGVINVGLRFSVAQSLIMGRNPLRQQEGKFLLFLLKLSRKRGF